MSADDKDAHKKGRSNDAASAQLRAEIEAKAKEIEAIHEDRVFDAENHVKDATEEYYEEIALEGDQFLRMSGGAEAAEGGGEKDATSELGTRWAPHRGQKIAYVVAGSGPAVVLQHGFLSNKEAYADYAAALVEAGFMTICTESLGHGESDKPPMAIRCKCSRSLCVCFASSSGCTDGLKHRAGDIAAVLDAEGVEKAHFIGYSMGGWIGTGMAK